MDVKGHNAPLNYHRVMLEDPHRMDAYERAIRALVRPGDVVLDVGTGTGILAMLAARRGAARVHAVESMPVAQVAKKLVAHNGLDSVVTVHHADLRHLDPIEPVDLIIGDFLGRFLVDDDMIDAVSSAARWLKPGGRFCPGKVTLKVAPVGNMVLGAVDLFWDGFYGLDYSPMLEYARNYCYHADLTPDQVLAAPAEYHEFSPPADCPPFDRELHFEILRPGLLRGIAGWFEAEMGPVTLATPPGVETHWGQQLFPLPELQVEAGDRLIVHLSLDDQCWRWRGHLSRAGSDHPDQTRHFDFEALQWRTNQR